MAERERRFTVPHASGMFRIAETLIEVAELSAGGHMHEGAWSSRLGSGRWGAGSATSGWSESSS